MAETNDPECAASDGGIAFGLRSSESATGGFASERLETFVCGGVLSPATYPSVRPTGWNDGR
jgi:hypothetical protein